MAREVKVKGGGTGDNPSREIGMSTFPRPNPTRVVAPTVLTPQPLSNTVLALRFVQSYPKPPRAIFSLTIQADLLDPLDLLDLHQGGRHHTCHIHHHLLQYY